MYFRKNNRADKIVIEKTFINLAQRPFRNKVSSTRFTKSDRWLESDLHVSVIKLELISLDNRRTNKKKVI